MSLTVCHLHRQRESMAGRRFIIQRCRVIHRDMAARVDGKCVGLTVDRVRVACRDRIARNRRCAVMVRDNDPHSCAIDGVFRDRERLAGDDCRVLNHVRQIDCDRVAGRQTARVSHSHCQTKRRVRLEVELARIGDRDDPRRTDREGTQAVATRDAEGLGIAGIHVTGQDRTDRRAVRGVLRDREGLCGNRRSFIDVGQADRDGTIARMSQTVRRLYCQRESVANRRFIIQRRCIIDCDMATVVDGKCVGLTVDRIRIACRDRIARNCRCDIVIRDNGPHSCSIDGVFRNRQRLVGDDCRVLNHIRQINRDRGRVEQSIIVSGMDCQGEAGGGLVIELLDVFDAQNSLRINLEGPASRAIPSDDAVGNRVSGVNIRS